MVKFYRREAVIAATTLTAAGTAVVLSQLFLKHKPEPTLENASPPVTCVEHASDIILENLDFNTPFFGNILKTEEHEFVEAADTLDKTPAIANPLLIVCSGTVKAYVGRRGDGGLQLIPAPRAELSYPLHPGRPVDPTIKQELIHGVVLHSTKLDSVPMFANAQGHKFGQIP